MKAQISNYCAPLGPWRIWLIWCRTLFLCIHVGAFLCRNVGSLCSSIASAYNAMGVTLHKLCSCDLLLDIKIKPCNKGTLHF